jgi:hypothetical protein
MLANRSRRLLVALAAAAVLLTAGCASAVPNRATELGSCAMVGRLLGAAPGHQAVWIKQIDGAQGSGNPGLDTAMSHLAVALRAGDSGKLNRALSRVTTICTALGLWHSYH